MYWSAFFVSKHMPNLSITLALPVHDAITVKQCDAEWAKEAMERVLGDETLGGKRCLRLIIVIDSDLFTLYAIKNRV
jgi:hypothetical protein